MSIYPYMCVCLHVCNYTHTHTLKHTQHARTHRHLKALGVIDHDVAIAIVRLGVVRRRPENRRIESFPRRPVLVPHPRSREKKYHHGRPGASHPPHACTGHVRRGRGVLAAVRCLIFVFGGRREREDGVQAQAEGHAVSEGGHVEDPFCDDKADLYAYNSYK